MVSLKIIFTFSSSVTCLNQFDLEYDGVQFTLSTLLMPNVNEDFFILIFIYSIVYMEGKE